MTAAMQLLDPETKAMLRSVLAENMPHTCHLQSEVVTTLNGRVTKTYADRQVSPCRMSSLGTLERERLMAGSSATQNIVAVFFPAGTIIEGTDRLIIIGLTAMDEEDVAWVRTFAVTGMGSPDLANEVQRRVIATELVDA